MGTVIMILNMERGFLNSPTWIIVANDDEMRAELRVVL